VKLLGKGSGWCVKCPKTCSSCTADDNEMKRKASDKTLVFKARLGSRNGVPARDYWFLPTKAEKTTGSYSQIMIDQCKKYGMKPVCDHKSYCRSDSNSIYIGQDHHLPHGGHRNTNQYFPSGWSSIKAKWDGLCTYTKAAHRKHALCEQSRGSHAWKLASQMNKFMCASLEEPSSADTSKCVS